MIQIPLEIGDTILAGRFKNKKITVKEIGVDDFGLPTINGRGILKIRIPKLYVKENSMKRKIDEGSNDMIPAKIKKEDGRYYIYIQQPNGTEKNITNVGFETEDLALHSVLTKGFTLVNDKGEPKPNKFTDLSKAVTQRSNEFKLSENSLKALKKIIVEVLNEVDVTDNPDLEAKAKRYAELANQMKMLEAQLKEMETEYTQLDAEFRPLLETVGKTKDTFIRAGKLLIKIERAAYMKKNPSYKTGFEWLHGKVNRVMKELADEAMAMVQTTTEVKSKIAVVNAENKINEGKIGDLINKFTGWVKRKVTTLFNLNKNANSTLDKLESYFK